MGGKDKLFATQRERVGDFRFDDSVADVFPDMIERSVPGYPTIVDGIGQLAARYAQPHTQLYDLGCSLGAVTVAMRHYLNTPDCQIIAVDNSEAMVARCRRHIQAYKSNTPADVILQDINDTPISDASVVAMNFTLQFIQPHEREPLLTRIFAGLKPGGVLLLSEKVRHETEPGDEMLVDLHHEFKRRNGYSELEISQKRTALENVMKIDSVETQTSRLRSVGFTDVITWFRCFNFVSMVAVKS
ncbi:carboxy-S-adenosyl-L-methionine synthase CmoA [Aestuariibacter salexigens]|uniref:carboxy-S-adenosyl-L-methionine synthase CmoA n=1 Tax=Aestuariibacter salexigens TaxID=226010 RepID=UPI000478901B|nr:carboxy-S-adenosyl-L-methionine synthase CmoA [Aestuariibacter salexigens]